MFVKVVAEGCLPAIGHQNRWPVRGGRYRQ